MCVTLSVTSVYCSFHGQLLMPITLLMTTVVALRDVTPPGAPPRLLLWPMSCSLVRRARAVDVSYKVCRRSSALQRETSCLLFGQYTGSGLDAPCCGSWRSAWRIWLAGFPLRGVTWLIFTDREHKEEEGRLPLCAPREEGCCLGGASCSERTLSPAAAFKRGGLVCFRPTRTGFDPRQARFRRGRASRRCGSPPDWLASLCEQKWSTSPGTNFSCLLSERGQPED